MPGSAVGSPLKAPWGEVAAHTARKLHYTDESYQMLTFDEEALAADAAQRAALAAALRSGCQLLVGFGVTAPDAVDAVLAAQRAAALPPVSLFFDSAPRLRAASRLSDLYAPTAADLELTPGTATATSAATTSPTASASSSSSSPLSAAPSFWVAAAAKLLPWSAAAKAAQGRSILATLRELYSRRNSEDFLFMFLVLANQFVAPVPAVASTTKGVDLASLQCMAQHCARPIYDCVSDATCKTALDCLNRQVVVQKGC